MKRGIILEKREKYVVVLTADGSFEQAKLTDRNVRIGQEIEFKPRQGNFFRMMKSLNVKLMTAALLFALLLYSFSFWMANKNTYAYVTVDINPSIELEVNKQLYIENIVAVDEEAESFVEKLKQAESQSLEATIDKLISNYEQNNPVHTKKKMLIGISYTTEPERKISDDLQRYIHTNYSEWQMITFLVPDEVREQAKENNTSMTKQFAMMIETNEDSLLQTFGIDEEKRDKIQAFYFADSTRKDMLEVNETFAPHQR